MAAIVKLVAGGSTFYLSPGATVTRTITRGLTSQPRPGDDNLLVNLGWTESDIIRVDTRVSLPNDSTPDGDSCISTFDITLLPAAIKTSVLGSTHTLYCFGEEQSYTGLVRSCTITQRSGEGSLFDVSIVFEVGDFA